MAIKGRYPNDDTSLIETILIAVKLESLVSTTRSEGRITSHWNLSEFERWPELASTFYVPSRSHPPVKWREMRGAFKYMLE